MGSLMVMNKSNFAWIFTERIGYFLFLRLRSQHFLCYHLEMEQRAEPTLDEVPEVEGDPAASNSFPYAAWVPSNVHLLLLFFFLFAFLLFRKHFSFSFSHFPHSLRACETQMSRKVQWTMWLHFFLRNVRFLFIFCRSQGGLCGLNLPMAPSLEDQRTWHECGPKACCWPLLKILCHAFGSLSCEQPLLLDQHRALKHEGWLWSTSTTMVCSHRRSCPSDPWCTSLLISNVRMLASALYVPGIRVISCWGMEPCLRT